MSAPKSAAEQAEEYAHKLTKDRTVFDGNDERIAIVAFKAGHAAGMAEAGGTSGLELSKIKFIVQDLEDAHLKNDELTARCEALEATIVHLKTCKKESK